jgi:hypothetical protein
MKRVENQPNPTTVGYGLDETIDVSESDAVLPWGGRGDGNNSFKCVYGGPKPNPDRKLDARLSIWMFQVLCSNFAPFSCSPPPYSLASC